MRLPDPADQFSSGQARRRDDGGDDRRIVSFEDHEYGQAKDDQDCGHGGRVVLRCGAAAPGHGPPGRHDTIADVPRVLPSLATHGGYVDTGSRPAANEDRGNKTKTRRRDKVIASHLSPFSRGPTVLSCRWSDRLALVAGRCRGWMARCDLNAT